MPHKRPRTKAAKKRRLRLKEEARQKRKGVPVIPALAKRTCVAV
jgi:hypothetical protein